MPELVSAPPLGERYEAEPGDSQPAAESRESSRGSVSPAAPDLCRSALWIAASPAPVASTDHETHAAAPRQRLACDWALR